MRLSGGLARDSLETALDGTVDATRLRMASREAELSGEFWPFRHDTFRANLKQLTGSIPEGAQAHHVFPQTFAREFGELGINVHDPRFGSWWNAGEHAQHSSQYNEAWRQFFRGNPTPSGAIERARELSTQYGYGVNF